MNENQDIYKTYESYDKKPPKHPIVPESSTYGAFFLAFCLVFVIIYRRIRNKSKK